MLISEFERRLASLPYDPPKPGQTVGCRPWRNLQGELLRAAYNWEDGDASGPPRKVLALKLGRPVLDGYCACHHCDYPLCTEPSHIYEGTYKQNRQDAIDRNRLNPQVGDEHWSRRNPEKVRRGAQSSRSLHPESYIANQVRGEENAKAKLRETEVYEIREASTRGTSDRDLAMRYGVKERQIHRIVERESWKHLPDRAPAGAGA